MPLLTFPIQQVPVHDVSGVFQLAIVSTNPDTDRSFCQDCEEGSRHGMMPKQLTEAASKALSPIQYTPHTYRALRNEVGVFTTPPYSAHVKPHWRYKDEETAEKSAAAIWELFQEYKIKNDFVGMDISRKFIQMGRTRSLRYALRKGGKKYAYPGEEATISAKSGSTSKGKRKAVDDPDEETGDREGRVEIPRTGQVYDQGKLNGAEVFRSYEKKCWDDDVYREAWEDWRKKGRRKTGVQTTVDDHET